ncbi:biotin-dependent carboxyltransferase family protein [Desulfobacula sp.]|uniref:5-oxoprolinase subunit C family protein n=1 Tax=Desulfobacula sp. TaxID=2593537 RepID=UPI001EBA3F9C|nr:biotin-dependent carboxyltransferase family protein [Desulfobacula sp.]
MSALKVLAPGGFTTVQDMGRFGYQQMGVPVCGVLDSFAFTCANILVGNDENQAVLEITVMGPSLEITKAMDIALTGAKMGMTLNDKPVEQWKSIRVNPGDILTISQIQSGCRAYLALSGGLKVPRIMGSYSTYVGGKIGGFLGRHLQKGDILETHDAGVLNKPRSTPMDYIPQYPSNAFIRAILGPQDYYFDQGIITLFATGYMVTAKADRMGYRLQGKAIPIKSGMPKSIVSEPSMPGSIQIPPDEQPIILLVEQTVGGYAKIATVISTDLSKVAQTTPGDTITFEKTDLKTAHTLYGEERNKINKLKNCF